MQTRYSETDGPLVPNRPEVKLLVHCAGQTSEKSDRLATAVEESLDWDAVVRSALYHNITPLVDRTLGEHCPTRVPDATLATLRHRSRSVAKRNLHLTKELHEFLEVLTEYDISALPYRGPILGAVAHGDITSRTFTDLDILVRPGDIPNIKDLLVDRGFKPDYQLSSTDTLTPTQEWAYIRFNRDFPFFRERDRVSIELHWRVLARRFPTAIELETVWDRRERVSLSGETFVTLSPEDRALMFCVHGTRHRWEHLKWLADLDALVRCADTDWEEVIRRARHWNCKRMVVLGPLLAGEVLGTPLPDAVARAVERDAGIVKLVPQFVERLFDTSTPWQPELRRLEARTLDRRRDRMAFWIKWMLYPVRTDIERHAFPRALVPLYFLTRPTLKLWEGMRRGRGQ